MTAVSVADSTTVSLHAGSVRAVVSRRAAALRALCVDGVELVEPTISSVAPPGMAGAILAPWPNRVAHASWQLDGVEQHLEVTEPELGHANHGLLSATDFDIVSRTDDQVALAARIRPTAGYPFDVQVEVAYVLTPGGVDVDVRFENLGEQSAPVATGAHPYLRVGAVPADELTVTLQADHEWVLGADHVPTHRIARPDGVRDLPLTEAPRHASYEAESTDGEIVHRLTAPGGRAVEIHADPDYRFTQLWIASALETDQGVRTAVAIEPMTAPPNALRTGVGLRWLAPREQWSSRWGIRSAPATRSP